MMLITNRKRLDWLVWTIVVSIGFYGIKGGVFTILQGGSHRVYGPPGTFIGGNNEMGLALAMTIPLMYYLYVESKKRYVRWGLLGAMLLTGLSAIGTHSRGALLGMAAMAVMLWWKSKQKAFLGMLIVFSGIVVAGFMPQEWFDRMATMKTYEEDGSARGRLDSWMWAFNLALSRPLGGGFEAFSQRLDAHSIYFEVLGEHGFIGLALFLMLWLFTWMAAARIRRDAEKIADMGWLALLMRMTQVSLVAYASAGAFLGMAYFDYPYNLVLIVVVAQAILQRTRQAGAEQSAAAGPPRPPQPVAAGSRPQLPSAAGP
jgi:probable O-glycosylation ligase (exosortase A-associated)